jgi:predicted PurR-regulated permease PerM
VSNHSITYLVAGSCGVFAVAAYVAFILVPAVTAYSRIWQRAAAAVLSLYVLAAFVALGGAGGAAIVWFWDRINL